MPQFIVPDSNHEDAAPVLREFNQCHNPGGTSVGGQFCSAPERAGGGGSTTLAPKRGSFKGTVAYQTVIGGEVVRMEAAGLSEANIRRAVRDLVERRAETPEEREFIDFIVDAEIHTARDLRDGDSKSVHTVPDPDFPGRRIYTEERLRVHDKVLQDPEIRNPNAKPVPLSEQPTIIFTGGLPASGKTFAVGDIENSAFGKNAVTVSNDRVKTKLPGYKGSNAYEFHEESSDIAHGLFLQSVAERKNIVYDFTFKDTETMSSRFEVLKAAGYRIEARFTDTDVNTSVASALRRAIGEETKFQSGKGPFRGRYIPIEHIRNSLRILPDGTRTSQNRITFEALKGRMSAYVIKDNNGLIAFLRSGGKTKAVAKVIEAKGKSVLGDD